MTPRKDDAAIVMLDNGPAFAISMFKFSENRVGSQFFTPQPGKLGIAK